MGMDKPAYGDDVGNVKECTVKRVDLTCSCKEQDRENKMEKMARENAKKG